MPWSARRPRRRSPTSTRTWIRRGSEVDPFDTPAFRALSDRAMNEIAATPANAQALNDLAVAIATTSLVDPTLLRAGPEAETLASSGPLRDAAAKLLELGLTSFPNDRAMTINLAYLRGLEGASTTSGCRTSPTTWTRRSRPSRRTSMERRPTRQPVRSSRTWSSGPTPSAAWIGRRPIAQPLIDDPETEAAGRIIRADSLLYAAERDQTRSPFLARSEVRRALDDYDRVDRALGRPGCLRRTSGCARSPAARARPRSRRNAKPSGSTRTRSRGGCARRSSRAASARPTIGDGSRRRPSGSPPGSPRRPRNRHRWRRGTSSPIPRHVISGSIRSAATCRPGT